jgi:hypothetical protein
MRSYEEKLNNSQAASAGDGLILSTTPGAIDVNPGLGITLADPAYVDKVSVDKLVLDNWYPAIDLGTPPVPPNDGDIIVWDDAAGVPPGSGAWVPIAPTDPAAGVVPDTRKILVGPGLQGGGPLSADVSIWMDLGIAIVQTPDGIAVNPGNGITVTDAAFPDAVSIDRTVTDAWYPALSGRDPIAGDSIVWDPAANGGAGGWVPVSGIISAGKGLRPDPLVLGKVDVGQNADNSVLVNQTDIQVNKPLLDTWYPAISMTPPPQAGDTIVWDGNQWVYVTEYVEAGDGLKPGFTPREIEVNPGIGIILDHPLYLDKVSVDRNTLNDWYPAIDSSGGAPEEGDIIIWDPDAGTDVPPTGAWVPVAPDDPESTVVPMTRRINVGPGLEGGGALTADVSIWLNLGPGIVFDATDQLAVNVDGVTLEVADVGSAPGDFVKVKDGGIANRHLGASIGGLTNVNISADGATDGQSLVFDGAAGEYLAKDIVSFVTPPPGSAGGDVPIWDPDANGPGQGGWVTISATAQAGAGLIPNATTVGVIDVGGAVDGSILVNADDITISPKGIQDYHIADGAVGNLQSSVTMGGLNNVDILADSPPIGTDILAYDPVNSEWYPSVRVDITTDQTIDSYKTFTYTPYVPDLLDPALAADPNKDVQAVNRRYVNTAISILAGQTSMVGTYDGTTGLVIYAFPGAPPSIIAGSPLPAADATNVGSYVLVGVAGPIPQSVTIGDWIMSDGAGTWMVIPLTTQYVTRTDEPNIAGDVHGNYSTGLTLDLGPGVDRDSGTKELYVHTDNLTLEVVNDEVRIKEAVVGSTFGVLDQHINAKIGALTNVNYDATSDPTIVPVTNAALVFDGIEWTASLTPSVLPPPVDAVPGPGTVPGVPVWNPGGGSPAGSGGWETISTESQAGIGLVPGATVGVIDVNVEPASGLVADANSVWVNVGAGIQRDANGLSVKVDGATIEIAGADGDTLQVPYLGIKNYHLGASIGGLTNVDISADAPTVQIGQGLVWDGNKYLPQDIPTIIIPGTIPDGGTIVWDDTIPGWVAKALLMDDLGDADTTTILPQPGQALLWDGTNWVPGEVANIDLSTPPVPGEVPVWDPAGGIPPGSGTWVPTMLKVETPVGSGLAGGGDLAPNVILSVDVGPGLIKNPELTINLGAGTNTLPQALEITPFTTPGGIDSDLLQIKRDGVTNEHLGASIGGLTNVDKTADTPDVGQGLVWNGLEYRPQDIPTIELPAGPIPPGSTIVWDPAAGVPAGTGGWVAQLLMVDDLGDADTTVAPTLGQALLWNGQTPGNWVPGDIVAFATPPPGSAGGDVPIWDPGGGTSGTGGWTTVPAATQAGVGLVPGVILGSIDINAGAGLAVDVPSDTVYVKTEPNGGISIAATGGIRVDTSDGIIRTANGIAVNIASTTTIPQALEIQSAGAVGDLDVLQVKFEGIKNEHLGAQLGALIDVNMSASNGSQQSGQALIWNTTAAPGKWAPGDVVSFATPPPGSTGGDIPVWDPTLPGGGGWTTIPAATQAGAGLVPGTPAGVIDIGAGPGISVHPDAIRVDTGPGIITVGNELTINLAGAPEQALVIDPTLDALLIKDRGIQNRHLGATIGGLTNVPYAADTAPDGSVLYKVGNDWVPYDPAIVSNPPFVLGSINDHTDVDTLTAPPIPGEGLIWENGNWVPGAPVGQGITPLLEVIAATTGPINILAPPADIDDIIPAAGSRILVKEQINPAENGIYAWGTPLVRTSDASTEGSLIPGNSVLVTSGTMNGGISFLVALDASTLPWTPDTDSDFWFATFSKLDIQAGAGLSLTGNQLNVGIATGEGLFANADSIGIEVRGVLDKHIGAYLGAMVDVSMAASPNGPHGTTGTGIQGASLIWDDASGQWTMGTAAALDITKILAGGGLTVVPSAAGDTVTVAVDTGPGIIVAPEGVAINVDNKTLQVNPAPPGDPLYDKVEIAPAGVKDIHLDARIGALTNVNYAATSGVTAPVTNSALIWDGGQWTASSQPIGTVGTLKMDDLVDADTKTALPLSGQALIWDGTANWKPGDVVSFTTPPTPGTPGVPIWDPGQGGWVTIDAATQAGAGLKVGPSAGVIDVGTTINSGIIVNQDDIGLDFAYLDTIYPPFDSTTPPQGGDIIVWDPVGGTPPTGAWVPVDPTAPGSPVVPSTRQITVSDGLVGGGPLSTDVQIGFNFGDAIVYGTNGVTINAGQGLKIGTDPLTKPDSIFVDKTILDGWYPAIDISGGSPVDGDTIVWDPTAPTGSGPGAWVPQAPEPGALAGAGITLNADGITFDVVAADGSIRVQADDIQVAPKGITFDKIADGAVGNLQSSVTLGGLNNVNLSADTPTVDKVPLIWDQANSEWVAGSTSAPASTVIDVGDGLTGGGDLAVGPVFIGTDLGAGLAFDAAAPYGGIYVNADDSTLTVNAADNLIVKAKGITSNEIADGAVGNLQLGAQLGALTDVQLAGVSNPVPSITGVGLVWNGAGQWVSSARPLMQEDASVIDDLLDVNTVSAPPVVNGADVLTWNGVDNWVPGERLTLDTAQTVTAVKTFSAIPLVPNLTSVDAGNSAVDKKYVDDSISLLSGQSQAVGTYDAITSLITSVFAGAPSEFVAGSALPTPAATNAGSYVLVVVAGDGTNGSYPTANEGDWIISDGIATWSLIPLSGNYVSFTDSPSVAGVITGSYSTGFQILDGAVETVDLKDASVTNQKLDATIGGLKNVHPDADAPAVDGSGLRWDQASGQWLPSTAPNVPMTTQILVGQGLEGGGPLSADVSIWIDSGAAIETTPDGIAVRPGEGIKITDETDLAFPDAVSINRTVTDTWYPPVPPGTPADGDSIIWDGAAVPPAWVYAPGGATLIDHLNDVDTTTVAPITGQALVWDSTKLPAPGQWVPITLPPGATPGAGLILNPTPGTTDLDIVAKNEVATHGANSILVEPDYISVQDGGITDLKLGAQLGALTNVEIATTEVGGTQTDGYVLTYDLATTTWVGRPGINDVLYNPGGPADTTGVSGPIVLPEYAASIQYVDDVITVKTTAPVAGTDVPKRDNLVWYVVGLPAPISLSGKSISADENTLDWTEPLSAGLIVIETYVSYQGAWLEEAGGSDAPAGAQSIDQLTDVDTSTVAPVVDQALVWNGVDNWVAAGPHLKLSGGTLVASTAGGTGVDTASAPLNNIRYNPAGPADILSAPELLVQPTYAASIQYVDDVVTVKQTAPTGTDFPKRDGQLWFVMGMAPPTKLSAAITSPTEHTLTWTEPAIVAEVIIATYVSQAGVWSPVTASAPGAISLDGLDDVDVSSTPPTGGQGLVWDDANAQWVPGGPHLLLTGGAMAGTIDMGTNSITNVKYAATGVAGGAVAPTDAAPIQYVDDMVTLSTTPGPPSVPPQRTGQLWLVATPAIP